MLIQMGRRQFLRGTAGLTALTATVPGFLHRTGLAFAGDPGRDVPPIRPEGAAEVRQAAAAALREVRYWRARRASAEVVRPSSDTRTVSFGMTVTLRREDGREQTFRIVGEDEADPSHGTVSYVSPLARAVVAYGPGDTVEIAGGIAVILVVR